MFSSCRRFYAMGSECAAHLVAESASEFETFARAAEAEVVRIERRYSRYRIDSEPTKINAAAACGMSVRIDDETEALIDYAAFDVTSGVLRFAWIFQVLYTQSGVD